MHKYNLQITEEQGHLIKNALDLYSRILAGQVEEISNILTLDTEFKDIEGNVVSTEDLNYFRKGLQMMKEFYLHIPTNASHGIHSTDVDDKARKAYDIHQVLRHTLAWDKSGKDPKVDTRSSDMIQVIYDTPDKTSTDKKFQIPIIQKI